MRYHQCSRKPTCEEVIEGKAYGFCSTHAPSKVKAKKEAKDAEWRARMVAHDYGRKREAAIRAATARCVEAMKEIRDGHNDPRSLASEVLAMFPDQGEKDAGK
jgi:hypothetical protein